MKKLLLAVLLLNTVPTLAQSAAPAKGATTIIISTSDSMATAYTKLSRLLLADGYSINKADKELAYINTDYKSIQANRGVELALKFVIAPSSNGTVITERGTGKMPYLGEFPASFRGATGSPIGRAWVELLRVGMLYSGAVVSYK
jgi:hypothetical protein